MSEEPQTLSYEEFKKLPPKEAAEYINTSWAWAHLDEETRRKLAFILKESK